MSEWITCKKVTEQKELKDYVEKLERTETEKLERTETEKCNQTTDLRLQTGGCHQTHQASLPSGYIDDNNNDANPFLHFYPAALTQGTLQSNTKHTSGLEP